MAIGPGSNPMSGGMKSKKLGLEPRQFEERAMMKIAFLAALLALAGCNTVNGIGQDISGGAQRVGGWF